MQDWDSLHLVAVEEPATAVVVSDVAHRAWQHAVRAAHHLAESSSSMKGIFLLPSHTCSNCWS